MTELKPCPFCGGTPYMAQNYLGQKHVRCPECGACVWGRDTDDWSIGKMGEKQAEKSAAEAWNRRAKMKISKWIPEKSYSPRNETGILYVCLECGAGYEYKTNFCPSCGAKMERSEE